MSSDREALIALFRSANGKFWIKKINWMSDLPYSKWYGIQVNSSGHVANLSLRSNYLQGSIESIRNWGCLKNIITLCLMDNSIQGSIPAAISDMETLEELDLSWNQLTGHIPSSVYSMKTLKILKLEHNQLQGEISYELGQLNKLTFLNLSFNKFSGKIWFIDDDFFEH
jgi:Leucine-rich repeat (LRR) protein